MKKRKSPVLLVTLLLVLVGVGVGINSTLQKKDDAAAQDQPKKMDASEATKLKVAEPRTPDSKGQIMQGIKDSFNKGGESNHSVTAPPPSVRIEKEAPRQPKPDPNRTAGQWYTKESGE